MHIYLKLHADHEGITRSFWDIKKLLSDMPKEFVCDSGKAFMEKSSAQDREWSLAALKEFPELRPLDDTDIHHDEYIGDQDGA